MNAQPNLGMQVTTFENPMGVDGFEFVEFAAPDAKLLHVLFPKLGFAAVAKHRTKNITLYRQGECNFLVNEEPGSFAADFAAKHGPWDATDDVREMQVLDAQRGGGRYDRR